MLPDLVYRSRQHRIVWFSDRLGLEPHSFRHGLMYLSTTSPALQSFTVLRACYMATYTLA